MKSEFSEVERAAWVGFVSAQGAVFRAVEENLRRKADITHAEYEVLLRLRAAEGRRERIQRLAAASLLSQSGVSRAVGRLERAGYVKRVDAEEDGRGACAELTKEGQARFESIRSEHVKFVRSVFLAKFSKEELETLAAFWTRFDHQRGSPE